MSEHIFTYSELLAVIKQSESVGYLQALDDAKKELDLYWRISLNNDTPWDIIDKLKSDYQKGKE